MNEEQQGVALAKLREHIPDHLVSSLPKPTKSKEEMANIDKATCSVCGGYHATRHVIHLDYVGHAAVTNILLDVDPLWSWEPLAIAANGLPVLDNEGGLWIKLTIAGVTRLGYGDAPGKKAAMKELIGDAIRNAAMRFGVALDLWHKGELNPDPAPDPVRDEDVDQSGGKDTSSIVRPEGSAVAGKLRPMSDAKFALELPNWRAGFAGGKKVSQLLAMLSTKYELTKKQLAEINKPIDQVMQEQVAAREAEAKGNVSADS